MASKNKHAEEHLWHTTWDWPKNNDVLGKVWLAECSYNHFHPGEMVGLRNNVIFDKAEK